MDRPRLTRDRSGVAESSKSVAAALRRAHFRDRLRALALASPLLILLLLSFGIPIIILLSRAVYDPAISNALPRTTVALQNWNGETVPDDATFEALAADIKQNKANGTLPEFAKSLNARLPGARSQILKTSRALDKPDATSPVSAIKAVPFWTAPGTWSIIETGTHALTSCI